MALPEQQRWQTEIWWGDVADKSTVLYGQSVEMLESRVKHWLLEHSPTTFSNASCRHEAREQIITYIYSDGSRKIPVFSIYNAEETRALKEGWYCIPGVSLYPEPKCLGDIHAAIENFTTQGMIVSPGPDYLEDIARDENNLLLRAIAHPAVSAALVGLILSICTVVMPINGKVNPIMASENPLVILLFMLYVVIGTVIIGMIILKTVSVVRNLRHKE